jgi:integrase/recombinase XerD
MPQGKQAKILTPKQEAAILRHLETTRYPIRDRVMFLLSIKAGLRAKEIAGLRWAMVTDAEGAVSEVIALDDYVTKAKAGGRTIPLHRRLRDALQVLHAARYVAADPRQPTYPVIFSERGRGLSASTVQLWFDRLYDTLGLVGCSSHSGRRTFITRAAKKVAEVGGSLRDVQQLAGHASLSMTQRYIEGDTEAKRKLVQLI